MKKNFIKLTTAFLATAMLLISPISGGTATDATVQSYNDRMADAAARQQAALDELERIRSEKSNAWYELSQYDEILAITESKKRMAEEYLESIYDQIEAKKNEIATKTESIAIQEDAFLKRMASAYMEGEASYLELLLGAEGLVDFLTRMDLLLAIQESDRAIIKQLKEDKVTLEAAEIALNTALELQAMTIKDYEEAIRGTKDIYAAKEQRIAELQKNEADEVSTYNHFKAEEDKLNKELENYLAELQKKSQSVYVGGSMAWPLDPSVGYYYSSEFGWRTLWGQPDNHYGIDIACAQNTKILAANSGTVIISDKHYSYGNYVVVDHGGGMTTLYAHMTSRNANVGDQVATGQCIGYVGMTGSASGHHLHFEVRVNGAVQQPRNYIVGPFD